MQEIKDVFCVSWSYFFEDREDLKDFFYVNRRMIDVVHKLISLPNSLTEGIYQMILNIEKDLKHDE